MERVLVAGGEPVDVVFSGVGKSTSELSFALKVGVGSINVESESEFNRLLELAQRLNIVANVALRINPDISVDTHPYIATGTKDSKFGIPPEVAMRLAFVAHQQSSMKFVGLACHLGSQISAVSAYAAAIRELLRFSESLQRQGVEPSTIDVGGGFGMRYKTEEPLHFDVFATEINRILRNSKLCLTVEPGRSLIGDSGVLLTKVEYLKPAETRGYQNYAIVDAAMNDLIRPTLYDAYHPVETISPSDIPTQQWHIVGPVCETGDFLAINRRLGLEEGMVLAVKCVGAYGFSQSSNYNSRPRIPEILVDGRDIHVIRQRETFQDLIRNERVC